MRKARKSHLILNEMVGCHIGASIRDTGKNCFGINLMQDEVVVKALLAKLKA